MIWKDLKKTVLSFAMPTKSLTVLLSSFLVLQEEELQWCPEASYLTALSHYTVSRSYGSSELGVEALALHSMNNTIASCSIERPRGYLVS